MKTIKILLALLISAFMLVGLLSCDNNDGSSSSSSEESSSELPGELPSEKTDVDNVVEFN
jgi:hypothetical protein